MPTDARRRPHLVAAVFADVIGSKAIADRRWLSDSLRASVDTLNHTFSRDLVLPFAVAAGDEIRGALADPAHAPLCVAVLRESMAPIMVRATVAIGPTTEQPDRDRGRDPFSIAADNLQELKRSGGLTLYSGSGPAGDILLNAICRLVDPLLRARTPKQWEAVAAYRRLGHQRAVAAELGVTRQSVGDRLAAGNWRATEDAAAAIGAYLSFVCDG